MNGTESSGLRVRGRFAPSPTGRMHLGNVYAAAMSWLSARRRGGEWVLRIEDIDRERSRREYAEQLISDLDWLGLRWDGPIEWQSRRGEFYEQALRSLAERGVVYACACTRADIMAASAPHQSDGRIIYGGRCRPAGMPRQSEFPAGRHSVRLWVPDREVCFVDRNFGEQRVNLARDCGDFIVRRADGGWAYQLAVTVDDALMGITEVVRGEDLLLSAAQQIYLFELLGYAAPEYAHIPLLRNEAGERLAKRDRGANLDELRPKLSPEELLSLVLTDEDLADWRRLR
ncbi:MAG: tRNA glutamyl-Q(34) synthetase GluQRS [Bacteroides sp.]|nr:tRNA glutamyl-Q(34) synthetase GluQRS [Bacteroidales bacterium]MBD5425816.1 tRNA glutamyl-Q(34) synthetase GluQRS [Bacteroides sp.]